MNKRLLLIIGGLLLLIVSIFIWILVEDSFLYELEGQGANAPHAAGSYEKMGYYKIDPKTILASLESGKTDVFTPLPEDEALDSEEIADLAINWTQEDFLKIASALGQLAWNDPMDLNDWSVYFISFQGSCSDSLGLVSMLVAYFRKEKNVYVTRMIDINPSFGWVRWGGERTHPQPILLKWRSVNLAGAKVTADDALRLVNDRVKVHSVVGDNICGAWVGSSREYPNEWRLIYYKSPSYIYYSIDFYTGEVVRN